MMSPDTNLLEQQFSLLLTRWADIALPPAYIEVLRGGFYAGVAGALSILSDEGIFSEEDTDILEAIVEELNDYSPERYN